MKALKKAKSIINTTINKLKGLATLSNIAFLLLIAGIGAYTVNLITSDADDVLSANTEIRRDVNVNPVHPRLGLVQQNGIVAPFKIPAKRTVLLSGEVSEGARDTAKEIASLSEKSKDPIYLIINSPGGSVVDGALIVQAIQASKAPVNTVCIQICASMAAIIFEYGSQRYMAEHAMIMFHPASGGAQGELDKMVSQLLHFQRFIGDMELYIANRTNLTFESYKALSGRELWLMDLDAVTRAFADQVVRIEGGRVYEQDLNFRGVNQRNRRNMNDLKIDIYMGQ